jgi:hypothetical protein
VAERQFDRCLNRPFRNKPDLAFRSDGEIELQRLEAKATRIRCGSDRKDRITDLFGRALRARIRASIGAERATLRRTRKTRGSVQGASELEAVTRGPHLQASGLGLARFSTVNSAA